MAKEVTLNHSRELTFNHIRFDSPASYTSRLCLALETMASLSSRIWLAGHDKRLTIRDESGALNEEHFRPGH